MELKKIDVFINDVLPIFWSHGVILILIFVIISIILIRKKNFNLGLVRRCIPVRSVLTTGINKVNDGNISIFFSKIRN